jgi:hypothetical protein
MIKQQWTKHEDEALVQAVEMYGHVGWKAIAPNIPGRTSSACQKQWSDKGHLNLISASKL